MNEFDVIVVGAGLSGLLTAVHLQQAGLKTTVFEARPRVGGRIYSEPVAGLAAKFDLGPTWFWEDHVQFKALLNELELTTYTQFDTGHIGFERSPHSKPEYFHQQSWPQPVSYRVTGSMMAVIERVIAKLQPNTIQLDHQVTAISFKNGHLQATVQHNDKCHNMLGKHVVVTLPPHLAQSAINYEPPLPTAVSQTMAQTQTWMGQAMKVSLVYKTPFWRQRGLSGLAVSYRGPVQQFHDASPDDDSCGALFGWLGDGGAGRELPFETRKAEIIEQVTRIFGPEGAKPLHYAELNWDKEPHTTETSYQLENPQEHPQYGHPLLQEAQLNGRLHFAVTEASPVNGGYLDGAVYIAKQVANRIISKG